MLILTSIFIHVVTLTSVLFCSCGFELSSSVLSFQPEGLPFSVFCASNELSQFCSLNLRISLLFFWRIVLLDMEVGVNHFILSTLDISSHSLLASMLSA